MTTLINPSTQQDLIEQTAALIDLVAAVPAALLGRVSYDDLIRRRNRTLENEEHSYADRLKRDAQNEQHKHRLSAIINSLPSSFEATIVTREYGLPYIKTAVGADLAIDKKGYSEQRVLVVSFGYGVDRSRRYPENKDGRFNLPKAVDFIRDYLEAKQAKNERQTAQAIIEKKAEARRIALRDLVKEHKNIIDGCISEYSADTSYKTKVMNDQYCRMIVTEVEGEYVVETVSRQRMSAEELRTLLAAQQATEVQP